MFKPIRQEISLLINYVLVDLPSHSSTNFRRAREKLMLDLLNNQAKQQELAQALALEHFAHLALRNKILKAGFNVKLAPQSIEASSAGHKGVDILITDINSLVYLGIDIKMRRGRSTFARDGYGWNKKLLSPYIYLSLGDFSIGTREIETVDIRHWLNNYALPKINTSGKIPHWHAFEHYLICRIERSLSACLQRWIDSEEQRQKKVPLAHIDELFGFPQTKKELKLFLEKMGAMQNLFRDLILV